jgi:hypothetical protein
MNMSLNLSDIPENIKDDMLKGKIEFSKKMGQLSAESRKSTKTGECLYCSKETNSYCNSHSIPASFLKNIAEDGKLYTHAGLIDLPLLKADTGVNNAGTFLIICRDCDSKIFKDYEDKSNYKGLPTQKMLAQIAMKNHLKSISQRAFEISLHDNIEKETNFDFGKLNKIKDSDLKENIQGFKRAKKVDAKCVQDEYYLFLYEKLDYVVPIAFQHQIALAVDLDGNVINNLYNHNSNYKIELAHIAIFPLEDSSIVMMFIDKKNRRYRAFIKQLNQLSTTEKLELINYIVFLYSEDFYLSKKVGEGVMNDEVLKMVSGKTGTSIMSVGASILDKLKESYDLSNVKGIPNLLSDEYKIIEPNKHNKSI